MRPAPTRFLLISSRTSAGCAVTGSGRPPTMLAVAFNAATTDGARTIVAGNGVVGGPGGQGVWVRLARVNPMIRFAARLVPVAIGEYTGPYPARVLNDAHGLGDGAVRAAPTVLFAFALPTNRPTTEPTAQGAAAGAR